MTRHVLPAQDLIDEALESRARKRLDSQGSAGRRGNAHQPAGSPLPGGAGRGVWQVRPVQPSFELLATLRRAGHPYRLSPQRQLADILGLTAGTVSLRVKHLVRQGLVRVEADPSDRRVRRVTLTDRGQQRFDDAAPAHLAGEEDLLRAVPRRAGRPRQAAAQAAAVVRGRARQPNPGASDRAPRRRTLAARDTWSPKPDVVAIITGHDLAGMDAVVDRIVELPEVVGTDSKVVRWIE
jgi:DNA-binding MarR family transcriptional regulator